MINPPININTRNRLAREQAPAGTMLLSDWARKHGINYLNFQHRMHLIEHQRSKAGRYYVQEQLQPAHFIARLKENNYRYIGECE